MDSLAALAGTASNVTETSMPGAHSDIGGGYGALDRLRPLVVEGSAKSMPFSMGFDTQAYIAELESDFQAFQASHPDAEYELKYEIIPDDDLVNSYDLVSVYVENRKIKYGLSNVALNQMYNQITKKRGRIYF